MENPWKIKSSKIIYDNPWIKLTEHQVINPSGNDGIYGTIHFKNLALGIIPLDDAYNTWIVGQYRFALNQYSWEIPEGGGKHDAAPLASAKRELLEEAGIIARDWKEIMKIHISNSVSDELGIIYVAKNLKFTTPQPDEDEVLEIKKLPFNELFEMVMEGEITDSLTVAGVLKTKILIDKGAI